MRRCECKKRKKKIALYEYYNNYYCTECMKKILKTMKNTKFVKEKDYKPPKMLYPKFMNSKNMKGLK